MRPPCRAVRSGLRRRACRAGGPGSYVGAHQRWRDYHADARVSGVAKLDPANLPPTVDDLAVALMRPARPLFIGRKPCLPTAWIFDGWVEDAPDVRTALRAIAPKETKRLRVLWPASEGTEGANRITTITDERNWITGLHGGERRVCEGELTSIVGGDRTRPSSGDLPNQALNHASSAVEAAAAIAVSATSTIPQLGFIHEDPGQSFVLDIADLFRDSLTIPVAFRAKEAVMIPNHKEAIQYVVDHLSDITMVNSTILGRP